MTDIERIAKLKEYTGLNYKALSEKLGLKNPQVFYDIQKGRHGISKKLADTIANTYPQIQYSWIISGAGEMLKNSENSGILINSSNISGNVNQDNRQYYSDSPDVLRSEIDKLDRIILEKEERIKEKDAQIKEKDAQIKEKDAQIKSLLEILKSR